MRPLLANSLRARFPIGVPTGKAPNVSSFPGVWLQWRVVRVQAWDTSQLRSSMSADDEPNSKGNGARGSFIPLRWLN